MSENSQKTELQKKISLKDFVEANEKLITAIGVMGALAAFFTVATNGQYIAFLSVGLLLVLYVEFYNELNKLRGRSATLLLFTTIATGFPFAICLFMAQTYWENFKDYFVPVGTVAAFSLLMPSLMNKFGRKKSIAIFVTILAIFMISYEILLPHLPAKYPSNLGNQTST